MSIKEAFLKSSVTNINNNSKESDNIVDENLVFSQISKLMIKGEKHQFTKLFLSKNIDVLKEFYFDDLYEGYDEYKSSKPANNANNCHTNLILLATQLQDDLYQNIIYSKINKDKFLNTKAHLYSYKYIFNYIFIRDDRKSFINLLENIQKDNKPCYNEIILFSLYSFLYENTSIKEKEYLDNKKSFFNWFLNFDIVKKTIKNNIDFLFQNEHLLCGNSNFICDVVSQFDKTEFSNKFHQIFKNYISGDSFYFPDKNPLFPKSGSVYLKENSHILFPYLVENNILSNIDENVLNFLNKRYKRSLEVEVGVKKLKDYPESICINKNKIKLS